MRKLFTLFATLALAVSSFAQSAEEIISQMEAVMEKHDAEGMIMTVDVKIPIIGTMTTKSYMLGDKMLMEASMMGMDLLTWTDSKTQWVYNSKTKEVEISNNKDSDTSEGGDAEMFENITDGYDVSISKQTADAWYISCKKSKSNKSKDDPKNMELVVSKKDYSPISLSTSMSGVKMTMRDISFGVTESKVTFDLDKYPGVKIVDKRK